MYDYKSIIRRRPVQSFRLFNYKDYILDMTYSLTATHAKRPVYEKGNMYIFSLLIHAACIEINRIISTLRPAYVWAYVGLKATPVRVDI